MLGVHGTVAANHAVDNSDLRLAVDMLFDSCTAGKLTRAQNSCMTCMRPARPTCHHSLQMLGMHGTVAANYAVDKADLLLAIGVRFDDRVTGKLEAFAARARIVHIDIDPAEINKNKASHITVCANAKPSLQVTVRPSAASLYPSTFISIILLHVLTLPCSWPI